MNERHPPAPRQLPAPIQWALTAYTERYQHACALADKIARIDAHINETEKVLRELRHGHADAAREQKAVTDDAETLLLMARQACAKLGIDMPPVRGEDTMPTPPTTARPDGVAADPPATADGDLRTGARYAAPQAGGHPAEQPARSAIVPEAAEPARRCGHCDGEIGWNIEQERWTHRPSGEFACDPQAELSPAANPDPAFREEVAVLRRPSRPAGDTLVAAGAEQVRSEGGASADDGGFQTGESPRA